MLADLFHTIRYGLRGFAKAPGWFSITLITLALGVGANVAMLATVDLLLLRPPDQIPNPDRVVRLYLARGNTNQAGGIASYPEYSSIRDGTPLLPFVTAFAHDHLTLGRGEQAEPVRVALVAPSYFDVFGVQPLRGTTFAAGESGRESDLPAVLLAEGFWKRKFGGQDSILGQSVTISNRSYPVVGILPGNFSDFAGPVDLWMPLAAAPTEQYGLAKLTNPGAYWLQLAGRIFPAALLEEAQTEVSRVFNAAMSGRVVLRRVYTIEARLTDKTRVVVWAFALSTLVLLICCSNVVNLLLVRNLGRSREFAVRLALGAGRATLLRQLLVENILLAVAGGVASLFVLYWLAFLLRAFVLPEGLPQIHVFDPRILLISAAVTLLTALLTGALPAFLGIRSPVGAALKVAGPEIVSSGGKVRNALVVFQVALSCVLLIAAGLFVRSLLQIRALDLGLDPKNVLVASSTLQSAGYSTEAGNALYERVLETVQRASGIERAALAVASPFQHSFGVSVTFPGAELRRRPNFAPSNFNAVSPDYHATLGIEILSGRPFTEFDRAHTRPVAIVNQAMARFVWGPENAVGKCLQIASSSDCTEIIGVCETARELNVLEKDPFQFYVPLSQLGKYRLPFPVSTLLVKYSASPQHSTSIIRQRWLSAAPAAPFLNVTPMNDLLAPQLQKWRLGATLFTLFGVLALALAIVGLYGVLSFSVRCQTREIGVRLALGANRSDILWWVFRTGIMIVLAGTAIGLAASLPLTGLLRAHLYGLSPRDPASLLAAILCLCAAACLACLVPSIRAIRVDPVVALRDE